MSNFFLVLLLFLSSFSLYWNYRLSVRLDALSKVFIFTQDYQDKYLDEVLKVNDLIILDSVSPPPARRFEDLKK